MSKNPFLQTHFVDLERGVKSKNCDNPGRQSCRKKARQLLDDKTGKIHRIKRKEKRPQKREHQFFRKNTKHAAQTTDNPRSKQDYFIPRFCWFSTFYSELFEDLRSRRKKRKGKKTFQSNFLVLSWEEYTKRIFTTGLKFEQFFQVPLLFIVQSKVLLVDEKWHLTRGFMFLD